VLEYIGLIMVNNALLITIVAAPRRGALRRQEKAGIEATPRWMVDAGKLRDARKIRMLMLIHKASGSCILQRAYSQQNLDGDLISGS